VQSNCQTYADVASAYRLKRSRGNAEITAQRTSHERVHRELDLHDRDRRRTTTRQLDLRECECELDPLLLDRERELVFRDRVCDALRLDAVRDPPRLLGDGTLPPFSRASLRPIAIACFRLFTLPPEPLRSVPFLRRCIADSTVFDAVFPYRAMCTSPMPRKQAACWIRSCLVVECA
jgi:hypothetical protein